MLKLEEQFTFSRLDRKIPTSPQRSRIMSAVRSSGNKSTEERLIKIMRLHKITRWRRNWPLPGKPDFAFPKSKLAVFVDGCFWHGCTRCYTEPVINAEYWREKIRRNILRDHKVIRLLNAKAGMSCGLGSMHLRMILSLLIGY